MKSIKRILFECIIIVTIFLAIHLFFFRLSPKKALGEGPGPVTFKRFEPAVKMNIRAFKAIIEDAGYSPGKPEGFTLAYDDQAKKLVPVNIEGVPWKYGADNLLYQQMAWASSVNVLAKSNNDLEARVRKLENTVKKIIAKCCPQVK